jgi:hypothetical protein
MILIRTTSGRKNQALGPAARPPQPQQYGRKINITFD